MQLYKLTEDHLIFGSIQQWLLMQRLGISALIVPQQLIISGSTHRNKLNGIYSEAFLISVF